MYRNNFKASDKAMDPLGWIIYCDMTPKRQNTGVRETPQSGHYKEEKNLLPLPGIEP
jgi:hypothetical protein